MNLKTIYEKFPTKFSCIKHLEKNLWNNKPVCFHCGSKQSTVLFCQTKYICDLCHKRFDVTIGTIFYRAKEDLQKWFLAVELVSKSKKRICNKEFSSLLELSEKKVAKMNLAIRKELGLIKQHVKR